jgi:SAM-dependent methyltransferase
LPATSNDGYGIDVAEARLDPLDSKLLAAVSRAIDAQDDRGHSPVAVLEIGCGQGALARTVAALGAAVDAIDRVDLRGGDWPPVQFFRASVPEFPRELDDRRYRFVASQRMLHYVRHADATTVLRWCRRRMVDGGELYLGVSGIDSELGIGYQGRDMPIADRWSRLRPDYASKHAISRPVCLYALDELVALVANAGFAVADAWTSDFGNLKVVARVPPPA